MKVLLASGQLEYNRSSNVLNADGSPLPRQGEGEGEGLPEATRRESETPHLSPLPFSEWRGEKKHVLFSATLGSQNIEGYRLGYRI
jgi:hypothetical protein